MKRISADRIFFYILLILVMIITLSLIWQYLGSVVLAITVAVVLQPMHGWFMRRAGDRYGPATALTLLTTALLVVLPLLMGAVLLLNSFVALSADVSEAVQEQEPIWIAQMDRLDQWLTSTGISERLQWEEEQVTQSARDFVADLGLSVARWLTSIGVSAFNLIVPMIIFISLLGTLLTNNHRAVQLFKDLSPLDNAIDQLFLDRLRIMTRAMMRSIVVVAVVQGALTGLLMALGGTPHIIPLTLLAIILSILPGGAAIIAVPVGLVHILFGDIWQGLLIILGTITLVSGVDNQLRPRLVSKDAYLNRAFVLLSVFSGIAVFGFMGVVYGPLIMILFSTMLEVYMRYYRPGPPEVIATLPEEATIIEAEIETEIETG
jgi:predicted PurR-regulated permease PerM